MDVGKHSNYSRIDTLKSVKVSSSNKGSPFKGLTALLSCIRMIDLIFQDF